MASDSSPPVFSWQFFVLIAAALGFLINQPGTLPLSPANGADKAARVAKADEGPVYTDSRLWEDPYGTPPTRDKGAAEPAPPAAAPRRSPRAHQRPGAERGGAGGQRGCGE